MWHNLTSGKLHQYLICDMNQNLNKNKRGKCERYKIMLFFQKRTENHSLWNRVFRKLTYLSAFFIDGKDLVSTEWLLLGKGLTSAKSLPKSFWSQWNTVNWRYVSRPNEIKVGIWKLKIIYWNLSRCAFLMMLSTLYEFSKKPKWDTKPISCLNTCTGGCLTSFNNFEVIRAPTKVPEWRHSQLFPWIRLEHSVDFWNKTTNHSSWCIVQL